MTASTVAATRAELAARYLAPQRMGNPIRDLHPLAIVLVLAGCLGFAVIASNLLASAAIGVTYYLLAASAGVGRAFAGIYGRLSLVAGGFLFLTRALLIPGEDEWFRFGAVALSLDSILRGLEFALFVLAISGAIIGLFTIVPVKRLLASIGRNGVDRRVGFVVLAAFQSIVDLGASVNTVLDAQRARGVETGGGPLRRVAAFVPILGPVFLTALGATEERALALDARGFSARGVHTRLVVVRPLRWGEVVVPTLVLLALLTAGLAVRLGWVG